MDELEKLIEDVEELRSFNGRKITIGQPLRNANKEIDLPIQKRIRHTDKAALDRDAMEKAITGNVDETKIDGIIEQYIKEKILREFQ